MMAIAGMLVMACAGRSVSPRVAGGTEVVRIERAYINSYLLIADRVVVVDTGVPGSAKRVLRALRRRGLSPQDVALIVLTHAHADHAGAAAELRARTGAAIVAGAGDEAMTTRGHNDAMKPSARLGRAVRPFIGKDYPRFTPDLLLTQPLDLHPFGVPGRVLPMPGHTPGSLAVVLDDGQAVAGDLVRGRLLAPRRPVLHFFHDDPTRAHGQLAALLDEHGVLRLHPGHGHALTAAALRAFLAGR
jgi:glyoxylase-like metal-dependent hydrolase (beta-lactamase superfamily II)